jgi:putative ABC transport system ATP-binding protein
MSALESNPSSPGAQPSAASTAAVLRLQAAERWYGSGHTRVRALGPVDLTVMPGEFLAVMGPSGSGKSTLLALAGGMDLPSAGQVLLWGRGWSELTPAEQAAQRRRSVGFVFQEFNLLPGLTAIENVALPLELDGQSRRSAREAARLALGWVGLEALAERFPEDLSGGEQQRVAIARAQVGPRRLILADEPTGALDSLNGERMMRLLRGFCERGGSVLMATHDGAQAAWADRIVWLRDGRWAAQSPADAAGAAALALANSTAVDQRP